MRIGGDVGGTFTDIVLERTRVVGEDDQNVVVTTVPSTPHDQSEGVVASVSQVCKQAGVAPRDIDVLFHGATVATNMVIERNGAEVGMLTRRGFSDIMDMACNKRPNNFSLQPDVSWQSNPLVKRRNGILITELLVPPTGEIEMPMSEGEVRAAAELFKKRGLDAAIVGFLFSFLNDAHEKRAVEIIKEVMPDAFVCASSGVVNVIREYERFSSTAMNAYIGPKTALYLRSLESHLKDNDITATVRIMQSNGGISRIEQSVSRPIGLLLSGPAGGVIGGRWTGGHCAIGNVITFDIGGTSADISVIQDGELLTKIPRDSEVADLPVLALIVDIDAIGAGSGSIAYVDVGGAFCVGPRSADMRVPSVQRSQIVLRTRCIGRTLTGAITAIRTLTCRWLRRLKRPLAKRCWSMANSQMVRVQKRFLAPEQVKPQLWNAHFARSPIGRLSSALAWTSPGQSSIANTSSSRLWIWINAIQWTDISLTGILTLANDVEADGGSAWGTKFPICRCLWPFRRERV